MKIHRKWRLKVDRSFSAAQIRQFLWVVLFLFLGYFGFSLLNDILPGPPVENSSRILDLLIDPGAFTNASEDSVWVKIFELLIVVFGAVIFTGVLISVISNMLDGRVNSFKAGELRYKFSDHILILGANKMLPNMIRDFVTDKKLKDKDIVIMTNRDIDALRIYLLAELDDIYMQNVTLLFGNRNSTEELKNVMAKDAERIYILGEDEEQQHDSINVACYLKLLDICNDPKRHVKCFLVIENATSYHILQFQKKLGGDRKTSLRLTIINSLENWAQQVLVSRRYKNMVYPPIDRGGITHDSDKHVHFVVVGMTQMALAMANNVAHIAHFPNFKPSHDEGEDNKTKITFICPNIKQEMHFFKGHYNQPITLSLAKYRSFDNDYTEPADSPDKRFGDFIDIEWEFISGGIEMPQIRDLLEEWCQDEKQILTLAICGKDYTANTASALYLPDCVFENQIPIFVYQPLMGEMLEQAHATKRYQNIFPFGMVTDCYDFSLRERIKKAKRINDIYNQGLDYVFMSREEELNEQWYNLSFSDMQSNIYAANSIPTKLRSIGISDETDPGVFEERALTEDEIEWLSECEQNRWNIEKLLVGFHALPRVDKDGNSSRHVIDNSLKEFMEKHGIEDEKIAKKDYFTHKNIRPYHELDPNDQVYNELIIKNIFDIINP